MQMKHMKNKIIVLKHHLMSLSENIGFFYFNDFREKINLTCLWDKVFSLSCGIKSALSYCGVQKNKIINNKSPQSS